ncbi:MAG: peptidoglycan bridge formation glycyltransferase FemA/FemB family protein, partial [Mycoplasmatales bacterium]
MQLKILTEQEYNKIIKHKDVSFQQLSNIKKIREIENWEVLYLGMTDKNNKVVAHGIFGKRKVRFGYYFDCQYGPILDYTNSELVSTFFKQVKLYFKKQNALFFRFNPAILRNLRNNKGEIITSYELEENNLLQNSFIKKVETKSYGNWDMHTLFVKNLANLTVETLKNSYSSQAKRSVKKAQKYPLKVSEVDVNNPQNLNEFVEIMELSANKKNFTTLKHNYYQNMKEQFGD